MLAEAAKSVRESEQNAEVAKKIAISTEKILARKQTRIKKVAEACLYLHRKYSEVEQKFKTRQLTGVQLIMQMKEVHGSCVAYQRKLDELSKLGQ